MDLQVFLEWRYESIKFKQVSEQWDQWDFVFCGFAQIWNFHILHSSDCIPSFLSCYLLPQKLYELCVWISATLWSLAEICWWNLKLQEGGKVSGAHKQHNRKVMQHVNFVFYGDIVCVILWCMHVLFVFLAWEIPVMLSLLNFTYELTSHWNKEQ